MRSRSRRSENAPPREGVDFGPFRLTLTPLQLWRGQKRIPLQPRPLAVLRYLVEHPETVISNDTLRQAVWGRTMVSATSVQVCVRAVRKTLGDETTTPRYIETVGREGYRFIAPLTAARPIVRHRLSAASTDKTKKEPQQLRTESQRRETALVGRKAELGQLHTLLAKALQGERQLVFVTGEAGIGKTTLVDAFLQHPAATGQGHVSPVQTQDPRRDTPDARVWLGRGQCLEHYGEGEAYLPMLEAVGQLCQGPDGDDFLMALRRYAPTWLLHLPGVTAPEERETLARQGAGTMQSQMLREMAEALEAVSAARGVVLVFEDLHVSDPSTIDLLAYLAQRRTSARLLIIGTYRPVEVAVTDHPLRGRVHELLARGCGSRLALESLTEAEVATYLRQRLGAATLPAALPSRIWQRTDGNALFVVSTVEYLLQQGGLVVEAGQWRLQNDLAASEIPQTLQHLITKQLDDLRPEQQRVLEVASVVGAIFTAASVAAGMQTTPATVEEVCEGLAQRGQFIVEQGLAEWPDGTVSGQYGFRHALYQEVLYERLGAGRRARVHLAIGAREEVGYGGQARVRAAELAQHFTQGRDVRRAVQYRLHAGHNALRRAAHVEALSHFSHGLAVLIPHAEAPEQQLQELELQMGLGTALMATKGLAAPEVEQALLRARILCRQIGERPELFPIVSGLRGFAFARGELRTARQLTEQLLRLAHDTHSPAQLGVAQASMQAILYHQGELAAARTHGELAVAQFVADPALSRRFHYGPAPEVTARGYAAAALYALGYADQSRQHSRAALALAQELGQVLTTTEALNYVANLHGAYGEWSLMQARAAELIQLATTHTLPFWQALGMCSHGIALTQQGHPAEGIEQIQRGLALYRAAGTVIGLTRVLGSLAEAYGLVRRIEDGLHVLDEAFAVVEQHDERMWEAELYRRKAELTLHKFQVPGLQFQVAAPRLLTPDPQVEADFLKAIDIARQQQAKAFELRAVISLSRLWRQQGKQNEARQLLAEIYGWFTEGFDTKDLQEAKALLDEFAKLSGAPR